MSALHRNNVHIQGKGKRAMIFAHGFGCDQHIWRSVAPSFERRFSTVLFDYVGAGSADSKAYSEEKYSTLNGYAEDVVDLGVELNIENAIFVGHSISGMIGVLASLKAPRMISDLVLIAPSPRYLDDHNYIGGLTPEQMAEQLRSIETDFMGWATTMAPIIMRNEDRPELSRQLLENFSRTDPTFAKAAARTFFTIDTRSELPHVQARSLVMQCRDDLLAPVAVGKYMQRKIPNSELIFMTARGHYPQLSAPNDTIDAIQDFIASSPNNTVTKWFTPNPADSNASVLGVAQHARRLSSRMKRSRQFLEDSLLRRAGELRMHLGRYDMYAVALERILSDWSEDLALPTQTIAIRGKTIMALMHAQQVPLLLIEQFTAIDFELQVVLTHQVIASRNSAVLVTLGIASTDRPTAVTTVKNRDWYDYANAIDDDIRKSTEAMDQEILKVVSLYVRLANCAVSIVKWEKRSLLNAEL